MAVFNFTLGNALSLKDDGTPNNGGKAYFLEPGTATAKTTYSDSALTAENSNPVIFNSAGRASIYFEGDADVKIYDASDVLLVTQPNVNPTANSSISAITSSSTLGADHNTNTIEAAGGITLTLTSALTLGAGWYVHIRNVGITNVTLARENASDTINGTASSYTLRPNEAFRIIVNAAATGFITDTLALSDDLTVGGKITMSSKPINESKGSDITAAATTDIGAATGNYVDIIHASGTVAISALGTVQAGTRRHVRFVVSGGTLTLTHNATSLILPGAADITVNNGDRAVFVSLGSGNWDCHSYTRSGVRGVTWRNQSFTSSGTFTVPTDVTEVVVTLVGAGGGGGSGGDTGATSGNNGSAGGATSFGTMTAAGGSGGQAGLDGGGGGAGGTGASAPSTSVYGLKSGGSTGTTSVAGGAGGDGASLAFPYYGAPGAGGAGNIAGLASTAGAGTVYGGGGGGGGGHDGVDRGGGGGGSGAIIYRRNYTTTPGESITVTVGTGGAGGARTTGLTSNGGAGANGICIVEWAQG